MNATPPLFEALPTIEGGFACVVCDPSWHFRTRSPRGQGRSPSRHYRTLSPKQILTLPVEAVLAPDAWLFFWLPDVHAPHLVKMMQALGFELSSKAFCPGPRINLFARESREGWVGYGDQATLFDDAT
jgi:N6-adenosine-specific RNA methylase IME4